MKLRNPLIAVALGTALAAGGGAAALAAQRRR